MNLSEPLHVTNHVRQGRVLRPYLFSVSLDDLSLEPTNIKGECYIGEIFLLNHMMFADDICVFWTSVCGLQGILDVCQAYAELHWNILNCSKTICMTLRLRAQKARSSRYWHCGVQRAKSVSHYKYLGIVLDTELSDDRAIQRQLRYQKLLFSDVRTQWKMYFFVSVVCPCMHHNYGMISESHACRDCVCWPIILDAELYTNGLGERGLVVIRFNVTFLRLRPCYEKMCRLPVSRMMQKI